MAIKIFDPKKNKIVEEKIYGEKFLRFLYPEKRRCSFLDKIFFLPIARWPLTSYIYGMVQKLSFSKKNILPFLKNYEIDTSEFEKRPEEFQSFNDFFIRKLKLESRPIDKDVNTAICPADGRYMIFPKVTPSDQLVVKGQTLSLLELVGEKDFPWTSATSAICIRLAPVDYHRFHFPVTAEVIKQKKIKGSLFSVNPIALRKNIKYLTENKRIVTTFFHPLFKTIYMVEIGATHVGSIIQTNTADSCIKGDEKGYFEFGGSFIVLVLENKNLVFDPLIIKNSYVGMETLGKMGEVLFRSKA